MMSKKTIEFTDEEYKSLVKLAFIGEWVLNTHHGEVKNPVESELVGKLYSECDKFNLGESFNKEDYDRNELKEEKLMEIIKNIYDYDESQFWTILGGKLAMRDAKEFKSEMKLQDKEMAPEMFDELIEDLEEEYLNDFENGGFENLRMMQKVDPKDN